MVLYRLFVYLQFVRHTNILEYPRNSMKKKKKKKKTKKKKKKKKKKKQYNSDFNSKANLNYIEGVVGFRKLLLAFS